MENGENVERWCIMAIDLSRYIQHRICGNGGNHAILYSVQLLGMGIYIAILYDFVQWFDPEISSSGLHHVP